MRIVILLTILFSGATLNAQYCSPSYGMACSDGDDINSFTLTGANSTSISDLNTGCTAGGYNDRTSLPLVEMVQGATYSGTISTNYPSNEFAKIWIDFDNNNVFDNSELLVTTTGFNNTAAKNFSISIPGAAGLNNHRMRVRVVYSTTNFDACNYQEYGEVHDYRVKIIANVLPIRISKFSGRSNGSVTILNWATTTELVGDRFEVQRSADGANYITLRSIQATGTPGIYSFVDEQPLPGKNLYRLGFINSDGSHGFSTVISIYNSMSSLNRVLIYPNPVRDVLTIQQNTSLVKAQVTITDMNGKLLQKIYSRETSITLPVHHFNAGSYFVIYEKGAEKTIQLFHKL